MGLKEHGQYHISFDENINLNPELKQYNDNYQSKNYNLLEKDKKEITKSCSSFNLKPKKIVY